MSGSAGNGDGSDLVGVADHARRVAEARARASRELFGPPPTLSEERRATAFGIFDRLVARIEGDLVASLKLASPVLDNTMVADRVAGSTALLGSSLAAAICRRADEHALVERIRSSVAGASSGIEPVAELLARDPDPALATLSMAYVVAAARRSGPQGEPLLPFDELSAADAATLVWLIAAALARGASVPVEAGLLERAAHGLLADHAPERGLNARARRLANQLHAAGADSDTMLASALRGGALPLAASVLATRGSLLSENCLDALAGGEPAAWVLLTRAAGVGPGVANTLFTILAGPAIDQREAASRLFVTATDDDVAAALARWRQDPSFASAIVALEV